MTAATATAAATRRWADAHAHSRARAPGCSLCCSFFCRQPLKWRSQELTGVSATDDWAKRAGARSFLWAAGWDKSDFDKPIITVACPWTNATPCNNHFRELGDLVAKAVEEEGGKAFVFGTPIVTDGEVQGAKQPNIGGAHS